VRAEGDAAWIGREGLSVASMWMTPLGRGYATSKSNVPVDECPGCGLLDGAGWRRAKDTGVAKPAAARLAQNNTSGRDRRARLRVPTCTQLANPDPAGSVGYDGTNCLLSIASGKHAWSNTNTLLWHVWAICALVTRRYRPGRLQRHAF